MSERKKGDNRGLIERGLLRGEEEGGKKGEGREREKRRRGSREEKGRREHMENISRIEQEVIITMNAAESEAEVYAIDPVYIRKLDKLCERDPEHYRLKGQDSYSKTYSVSDKKLISFRQAREKQKLSDEQRAIRSERMKTLIANRAATSKINSEPRT